MLVIGRICTKPEKWNVIPAQAGTSVRLPESPKVLLFNITIASGGPGLRRDDGGFFGDDGGFFGDDGGFFEDGSVFF
jgi:hypothetical protein